jgi:NADH pyrophosphatase NudC (nudix superfamily)
MVFEGIIIIYFPLTMTQSHQIRLLALGLIRNGDRTFLAQGYDPVKQQTFYRALGGGVDFGETSYDALTREFQEELQAELTNIQYLGCKDENYPLLTPDS